MKFFENPTELNLKKEKYQKSLLDKVNKYSKKVLFGIGESCDAAIDFFSKNNIVIDGIYDDDANKDNTYYKDILITLPHPEEKDVAIIVTCSFYEGIKDKLSKVDSNIDKRLFLFDGYFLEDYDASYFLENKDKIMHCYNVLEDEYSRALYEALLEYRYVRDPNIIASFVEERSKVYFDDIYLNNFKEGTIVDVGAYKGLFMLDLSKRKDISNCKFYLFEPNINVIKDIKNNLSNFTNYEIVEKALCDKKCDLEFTLMQTSTSHILDNKYSAYKVKSDDIITIEADTLDSSLGDEFIVTIKVDIEGSEQSFIKGATNTLRKNKPILLLSIYHKASDLWELIDYIDNLNLGYKFYLHHYSKTVAKSILYCIPE